MVRRAKVRCVGQLCVKSLKVNNMCSPLFLLSLNSSAKNNKDTKNTGPPIPFIRLEKSEVEGQKSLFPDKVTVAVARVTGACRIIYDLCHHLATI